MAVFNMLNVKYFIQGNEARTNPGALGNAWLVKEVNVQASPNMEILSLGNLFLIENKSQNQLLVNNSEKKTDTITGREQIVLLAGDSISLDLMPVIRSGMNSSFVQDVNGQTNWIPNAELAKDTLGSFTTLVSVQSIHNFDPKNEVIVGEAVANNLSSLTYSGEGSIEMTSYAPNALSYQVNVEEQQFAVFSEVYYPKGWNAYIDGELVDIERVNYLLRGIELPSGNYTLEMRFEVPKFKTANNIALAGSILLFILIRGFFFKDFLMKNEDEVATEYNNHIMNRPIGVLSILRLLSIIVLALLMFTGVINFVNNFKYLVLLSSVFLTLFSLGWFVHHQELSRLLFVLVFIVLAIPLIFPIMGLIEPDLLLELWKVFVGGSLFQIGTGIFAILGGFIKKGLNQSQKILSILNYAVFLFLSSVLILNIESLMNVRVFVIVGGIASLLSVLLVITRKPTISL